MTSATVLAHQLEKAQASGDIIELEHALKDVDLFTPVACSVCSSAFLELVEEVRSVYHTIWEECKGWVIPLRHGCALMNEKLIFTSLLKCQQAPPDAQLHMYQDMRYAVSVRQRLVEVKRVALQLLEASSVPFSSSSPSLPPHSSSSPPTTRYSLIRPPQTLDPPPVPLRGENSTSFSHHHHRPSPPPSPPPRNSNARSLSEPDGGSSSPAGAAVFSSSLVLQQASQIENFLGTVGEYLSVALKEALQRRKQELEALGTRTYIEEKPTVAPGVVEGEGKGKGDEERSRSDVCVEGFRRYPAAISISENVLPPPTGNSGSSASNTPAGLVNHDRGYNNYPHHNHCDPTTRAIASSVTSCPLGRSSELVSTSVLERKKFGEEEDKKDEKRTSFNAMRLSVASVKSDTPYSSPPSLPPFQHHPQPYSGWRNNHSPTHTGGSRTNPVGGEDLVGTRGGGGKGEKMGMPPKGDGSEVKQQRRAHSQDTNANSTRGCGSSSVSSPPSHSNLLSPRAFIPFHPPTSAGPSPPSFQSSSGTSSSSSPTFVPPMRKGNPRLEMRERGGRTREEAIALDVPLPISIGDVPLPKKTTTNTQKGDAWGSGNRNRDPSLRKAEAEDGENEKEDGTSRVKSQEKKASLERSEKKEREQRKDEEEEEDRDLCVVVSRSVGVPPTPSPPSSHVPPFGGRPVVGEREEDGLLRSSSSFSYCTFSKAKNEEGSDVGGVGHHLQKNNSTPKREREPADHEKDGEEENYVYYYRLKGPRRSGSSSLSPSRSPFSSSLPPSSFPPSGRQEGGGYGGQLPSPLPPSTFLPISTPPSTLPPSSSFRGSSCFPRSSIPFSTAAPRPTAKKEEEEGKTNRPFDDAVEAEAKEEEDGRGRRMVEGEWKLQPFVNIWEQERSERDEMMMREQDSVSALFTAAMRDFHGLSCASAFSSLSPSSSSLASFSSYYSLAGVFSSQKREDKEWRWRGKGEGWTTGEKKKDEEKHRQQQQRQGETTRNITMLQEEEDVLFAHSHSPPPFFTWDDRATDKSHQKKKVGEDTEEEEEEERRIEENEKTGPYLDTENCSITVPSRSRSSPLPSVFVPPPPLCTIAPSITTISSAGVSLGMEEEKKEKNIQNQNSRLNSPLHLHPNMRGETLSHGVVKPVSDAEPPPRTREDGGRNHRKKDGESNSEDQNTYSPSSPFSSTSSTSFAQREKEAMRGATAGGDDDAPLQKTAEEKRERAMKEEHSVVCTTTAPSSGCTADARGLPSLFSSSSFPSSSTPSASLGDTQGLQANVKQRSEKKMCENSNNNNTPVMSTSMSNTVTMMTTTTNDPPPVFHDHPIEKKTNDDCRHHYLPHQQHQQLEYYSPPNGTLLSHPLSPSSVSSSPFHSILPHSTNNVHASPTSPTAPPLALFSSSSSTTCAGGGELGNKRLSNSDNNAIHTTSGDADVKTSSSYRSPNSKLPGPFPIHSSSSTYPSSFPSSSFSPCYSSSYSPTSFSDLPPINIQRMRLRGRLTAVLKEEAICRKDILNAEEMERAVYLFFSWNN